MGCTGTKSERWKVKLWFVLVAVLLTVCVVRCWFFQHLYFLLRCESRAVKTSFSLIHSTCVQKVKASSVGLALWWLVSQFFFSLFVFFLFVCLFVFVCGSMSATSSCTAFQPSCITSLTEAMVRWIPLHKCCACIRHTAFLTRFSSCLHSTADLVTLTRQTTEHVPESML